MPCLGSNDQDRETCTCITACLGRCRRRQRPEAPLTKRPPREVVNNGTIRTSSTEIAQSESAQETPPRDNAVLQAVPQTISRTIPRHPTEGQAVLSAAATGNGNVTSRFYTDSTGGTNLRVSSLAGPLPTGPAVQATINRVPPASAVAEPPLRPSLAMPRTRRHEFEVRITAACWIGLKSEGDCLDSLDRFRFVEELAQNYNRATPVQHPRMRRSMSLGTDDPNNEWVIRSLDWPRPGQRTTHHPCEPLLVQVKSKGT